MRRSTAWALAHPAWFGAGVMVLWQVVVYGFGALDLPWLLPGWFPHLGVVVTNGLGAAAVLLVGWRCGLLGRSALRRGHDWRWAAPLVVIALGYVVLGRDGVPGLTGSAGLLLSSAAGMAAVGVSEELAGRGVGLSAASSWRVLVVVRRVDAAAQRPSRSWYSNAIRTAASRLVTPSLR